jgi:Protein of unknown function (DUF3800)
MDFEAYYDSSGRRGQQPATTLAGVAASKEVWEKFHPAWQHALDESGVPERRFGMADLMACRGRFKGWDTSRKQQLLNALLNVLANCRPAGMSAYSCTVFFDAYDGAKAQMPTLRKLEAICVNHCVGGLRLTSERTEGEPISLHLFFDRNEPFLKTVDQIWRQLKKKKRGWAHQVRGICPIDDSYYGIQAADLLAWIVNRHRCEAFDRGDPQPTAHLSMADDIDRQAYLFICTWMMVDHHMMVYDHASKIIEYGKALESVRNAQLKS